MSNRITLTVLSLFWTVSNLGAEPMENVEVASSKLQTVSFHRATYDLTVEQLLKSGDFEGAQSALRREFRTRGNDPALHRELEDLQRILRTQMEIGATKSRTQKTVMVDQLRRYYLRHEIHGHNIDLAIQEYRENPNTKNAGRLIEAYVHAEHYPRAIEFIESLAEKADERFRIEKARIFILDGRNGEAIAVLRSVPMEKIDSPELLLAMSRLQALTRQNASAVKTLARCFELMPLTRLGVVRQEVSNFPEFQAIRSTPEFLNVLQIRSEKPCLGKPCAQKWAGDPLHQEPEYIKKLGKKIDLEFWRVN